MGRKTLNVSDETHNRLTSIGSYGESMDYIINKCIDAYKKEHKTK